MTQVEKLKARLATATPVPNSTRRLGRLPDWDEKAGPATLDARHFRPTFQRVQATSTLRTSFC